MKVSITNKSKKNRNSPIRNYFRNEDFKEIKIKKYLKKKKKYVGESGLGIERLITGLESNKIYSKYLLNYKDPKNQNLLKIKLWIQPTFNEFQQVIKQNCEKFYAKSIEALSSKNMEEEKGNDEEVQHIYYEDDSSIITLAKV